MLKVINRRIPVHGPPLRRFCKWLNKHYPLNPEILVEIILEPNLNDFIAHELDEGRMVSKRDTYYALYVPELGTIFLSQFTLSEDLFLTIFAHEYCHALQHTAVKTFTERDADAWAIRALMEYRT